MTQSIEPLILDLLEWIGPDARSYSDVIDAWKTSCPRLPVLEEANARGFLIHQKPTGQGTLISVSEQGNIFLREHRPAI